MEKQVLKFPCASCNEQVEEVPCFMEDAMVCQDCMDNAIYEAGGDQ